MFSQSGEQRFTSKALVLVCSLALITGQTYAGQPIVSSTPQVAPQTKPEPLTAGEMLHLVQRDAASSHLRTVVAGANSRTCDGCGGSGSGRDFNRRQGLPTGTAYDKGKCPRCGGSGILQMEGFADAARDSDFASSRLFLIAGIGAIALLAVMIKDANDATGD